MIEPEGGYQSYTPDRLSREAIRVLILATALEMAKLVSEERGERSPAGQAQRSRGRDIDQLIGLLLRRVRGGAAAVGDRALARPTERLGAQLLPGPSHESEIKARFKLGVPYAIGALSQAMNTYAIEKLSASVRIERAEREGFTILWKELTPEGARKYRIRTPGTLEAFHHARHVHGGRVPPAEH